MACIDDVVACATASAAPRPVRRALWRLLGLRQRWRCAMAELTRRLRGRARLDRRRAVPRGRRCARRRASTPVAVRGEISGFSRAASGHCYFALKDADGGAALRCAMFRRAAGLLDFAPRDGELVEVRGRLAVYEPRGELQLVVESHAAGRAGRAVRAVPAAARRGSRPRACSTPARKRAAAAHAARRSASSPRPARAALHDVRDGACAARAARSGGRLSRPRCRAPTRRPSCARAAVALRAGAAGGRRDPAGARRRLDRGPVGLQRRALARAIVAEPGAGGQRRRPRDRLHHRRLLRRPARADADRRGRARGRAARAAGSARCDARSSSGCAARCARASMRRRSGSTGRRCGSAARRRCVARQQLRAGAPGAAPAPCACCRATQRLAQAQHALQAELPLQFARALAQRQRARCERRRAAPAAARSGAGAGSAAMPGSPTRRARRHPVRAAGAGRCAARDAGRRRARPDGAGRAPARRAGVRRSGR